MIRLVGLVKVVVVLLVMVRKVLFRLRLCVFGGLKLNWIVLFVLLLSWVNVGVLSVKVSRMVVKGNVWYFWRLYIFVFFVELCVVFCCMYSLLFFVFVRFLYCRLFFIELRFELGWIFIILLFFFYFGRIVYFVFCSGWWMLCCIMFVVNVVGDVFYRLSVIYK